MLYHTFRVVIMDGVQGPTYIVILKDDLSFRAKPLLGALVTIRGCTPALTFREFTGAASKVGKSFFVKRINMDNGVNQQEWEDTLWAEMKRHMERFEERRSRHGAQEPYLPYIPPVKVYSAHELVCLCAEQGFLPDNILEA